MPTITVADRAGLLSALSSSKGGDTIVLKNGNYGSLTLNNDYSSTVTIKAEQSLGASVSLLTLQNATNIKFDGIKFSSGMNGSNGRGVVNIEQASQNVAIVNSEVTGSVDGVYEGHFGIYVRSSNGITLENNNVHDVRSGIVMFGSASSTVRNNAIDYFSEDGMKLAGLSNGVIDGNVTLGHIYPTAGAHNDFIQFQGASNNLTVTDNVFLAATIGSTQGIFFSDGTYQNVRIENNLIYTDMLRGISVSDGSTGIVVNNNTLLNVPGGHAGTTVMVPGGSVVTNNIMMNYAGGPSGSNLVLQNTNPNAPYYVDSYFQNGDRGLGVTVQDLSPVAGSLATSKGAVSLLASLLGGGTPAPAAPSTPTTPTTPTVSGDDDIAINTGGTATGGFDSDAFYFGGSTYKTSAAIGGTDFDSLYQTERYGNFRYEADVDNGTFDVTLKFAEIYLSGAGQRLFDVKAEGKLILDNYDIFKEAGGKNIAVDETFRVTVTDGDLDLEFISVRDNAKISGIEISPVDDLV